MSNTGKRLLAFGPFELDAEDGLLYRDGAHIALAPKVVQLLTVLARSAGRLLTKDELMKALWPDTFVEEHNLTLHIHTLRKTLDRTGAAESYIETVPRRGYRFIPDVREIHRPVRAPSAESAVVPIPPGEPRRHRVVGWLAASVAAIVLVAVLLATSRVRLARATGADGDPDIARLTNNVADDTQPDVSPDGKRIVFVSNG